MAWIPEPTERLRAFYGPTDNPAFDRETTRLENDLQSFEQIKATCRKYHVLARIVRKGKFIGEVAATGEYEPEPV